MLQGITDCSTVLLSLAGWYRSTLEGITDYTIRPVTAVTMHITITVYVLSAFKKPEISDSATTFSARFEIT
jgi:hypothetical protein